MTQLTQLTKDVFAVEAPAPEHAVVAGNTIIWQTNSAMGRGFMVLPPGTWHLICTTREATEEQAASVVQMISNGKISGRPQYRRYDRDLTKEMPARCWTRDPRHALETLLTSKGLDVSKNYVLVEKEVSNG